MDTSQGLPSVILLSTFCTSYTPSLIQSVLSGLSFIAFIFLSDLAGLHSSPNSICGLFIQHICIEFYAETGQSALYFKKIYNQCAMF